MTAPPNGQATMEAVKARMFPLGLAPSDLDVDTLPQHKIEEALTSLGVDVNDAFARLNDARKEGERLSSAGYPAHDVSSLLEADRVTNMPVAEVLDRLRAAHIDPGEYLRAASVAIGRLDVSFENRIAAVPKAVSGTSVQQRNTSRWRWQWGRRAKKVPWSVVVGVIAGVWGAILILEPTPQQETDLSLSSMSNDQQPAASPTSARDVETSMVSVASSRNYIGAVHVESHPVSVSSYGRNQDQIRSRLLASETDTPHSARIGSGFVSAAAILDPVRHEFERPTRTTEAFPDLGYQSKSSERYTGSSYAGSSRLNQHSRPTDETKSAASYLASPARRQERIAAVKSLLAPDLTEAATEYKPLQEDAERRRFKWLVRVAHDAEANDHLDDAIDLYRSALSINSSHRDIRTRERILTEQRTLYWRHFGLMAQSRGNFDEALHAWSRVVSLEPNDARARLKVAELQELSKRTSSSKNSG